MNLKLNTIELTPDLVQKFVTTDYPKNTRFPFDRFGIMFRLGDISGSSSKERLFEQCKVYTKNIHKLQKAYDLFNNEICTLMVDESDSCVTLDLVSRTFGKMMCIKVDVNGITINSTLFNTDEEKNPIAYYLIKILHGTVYQFNNPNVILKTKDLRERKTESKVSGYVSPSKKYIYRVKYIIENAQDAPIEKKEHVRHTES